MDKFNPKLVICLFGIFLFFLVPFVSFADDVMPDKQTPTSGLEEIQKNVGSGLMPDNDPVLVIVRVVNYVLTFIGVIFLMMTIYGGFMWMTAAGNEEKVKKGKGLLQTAVIGLVIVILARVFYIFIQDRVKDFTQ